MTEEITLNDYILTNIDLETGYFAIRLKDNKGYIVYYKKSNGKTINYIEKDNKQIPLSEEVLKIHLEEIRTYQKSGI